MGKLRKRDVKWFNKYINFILFIVIILNIMDWTGSVYLFSFIGYEYERNLFMKYLLENGSVLTALAVKMVSVLIFYVCSLILVNSKIFKKKKWLRVVFRLTINSIVFIYSMVILMLMIQVFVQINLVNFL